MGINSPGSPSSMIPPGEDFAQRQIKDLQRDLRELAPSVAKSFGPVITRLDATDADLAAKDVTLEALIGQQVTAQVGHADAYNFALTPAWSAIAQITVTVPAGYTRALVIATGNASVKNPTAAQDYLWASVGIGPGTSPGYAMRSAIVAADYGSATNSCTRLLEGLTGGGTFAVYLDLSTDIANWSASTSNSANLDAAVTFLR